MTTKITVNEKTYDNVDAMPPDVRAIYEQAMRAASEVGPSVGRSEIKMTFQMTGPHLKFRVGSGTAPGASPTHLTLVEDPTAAERARNESPRPIEPASGGVGLQVALVVAAGLAIGLAFWFWARLH